MTAPACTCVWVTTENGYEIMTERDPECPRHGDSSRFMERVARTARMVARAEREARKGKP